MRTFWQDIRFALQQLCKPPVFAAKAILTLAIRIGANAAIFPLIDDAMLRSLPVLRPFTFQRSQRGCLRFIRVE
jgi:putative ABC transport system permease protein